MLDFSSFLDLPLIWGGIIAIAIFLYVLLDGFDLGVGILLPFVPEESNKNLMINSIAPFWDGNETWLVMGGGGLFAAFPLAYAVLMSAFYLPIAIMLLALVFRGVAFEFRLKSPAAHRKFWDVCFHFGSLFAALMQGMILGHFVCGVEVSGREFSGSPFGWVNGFSFMVGIAVVFGYVLLGSTWLVMKTDGHMQTWSRSAAKYSMSFVALFMGIVSITLPAMDSRIFDLWFADIQRVMILSPIPIVTFIAFVVMLVDLLKGDKTTRPFVLALFIFAMGYIGLGISVWPWVVPFQFSVWDAAASAPSLSLLLVGTVILLPVVLGYTAYTYYLFRGKASAKSFY